MDDLDVGYGEDSFFACAQVAAEPPVVAGDGLVVRSERFCREPEGRTYFMYSCTAIWSPGSNVQSSGSAYLYNAVARAISGFAGGAEGARLGREGAAGVVYAGGGGSLRRMLLKALVGAGAGAGAWA